ncbi:MAG: bifunctional transaldolase/phosoglucose isomerase, partial [Gemmatimonadales bacterium]
MNRLGWMDVPEDSLAHWDEYTTLAATARADGLDRVLVCGMGGSSLTPHVLAVTAPERAAGAALHVLDSTNPAAVLHAARAHDAARTLFVITSKSGTTVETLAFYHYFAARADPRQFIAITDPGTPLEALARARGFRAVLPHPVDVGGRYSALSVVGMLPAALLGLDGRVMLERTRRLDVAAAKALG